MQEKIFIRNKIDFKDHSQDLHLGDAIVILNLIYNRYLITKNPIEIYGPNIVSQLMNIFKYEGLNYKGENKSGLEMNYKIKDFINGFEEFKSEFLNAKFCHIAEESVKINKFELPKYRSKTTTEKNNILFQFDNRTLHTPGKELLLPSEIKKILLQFNEEDKVFGIGGEDTNKYLNDFKFKIGNLHFICHELNNCKIFIGTDSGISHLAGTLEINSLIVNSHTIEPHLTEINKLYNLMYEKTIIKSKKEMFKKCKLHI